MEILNKLYRSVILNVFEDGYGGSPAWLYFYQYIFLKENECYLFYSFKPFEIVGRHNYEKLKPIHSFDDSKTIKSIDIILKNVSHSYYEKISNNEITFSLPVHVANEQGEIIEVNRIYSAILENDGELLKLKAFDENNPDVLTIDAEFEKVDLKAV